jgi:TusA-related sulfurtransferase
LRALQNLPLESILEIILDNPPSVKDIPITIEKRGYKKPEVVRVDKGTWKIIVQNPK